jgi:hypothetical protein
MLVFAAYGAKRRRLGRQRSVEDRDACCTVSQFAGDELMSLLKRVTPAEAKIVWASIPNPSARRVAKALTQSGRRVHYSTIARWHAQGWWPVAHSLHPLEAASQAIDVAAGVLTGDPVAGLEAFLKKDGGRQQLEGLSDRELLRKASREMLIVINLVCHILRAQLPLLVATKQIETAALLNAIVAACRAATDGLEQSLHLPDEPGDAVKDSGKSDDPLASVLNKFSEASGQ